ncbi:MAG TPA: FAD-dependent oxidoreductase [Vicinamibacterales bacterium]|jgi:Pyruvate/2-oxoacid:ferredoxin oxidoreductase delta subunit
MPIVKKVRKLGARSGLGAAAREGTSLRPQLVARQPPCEHACPNDTDVRGFLAVLARSEGRGLSVDEALHEAFLVIAERNPLPAVCGYLCPHHCESRCHRDGYDGAVAVNGVERAIGETAVSRGWSLSRCVGEPRPEPVTVVGAGAGGLSAAYQLARRGYAVRMVDPHEEPGGELRYGPDAACLPRHVLDAEIGRILALGVTFVGHGSRPEDGRVIATRIYEDGHKTSPAGIPAAIHFGRRAAELLDADIRGVAVEPPPPRPPSTTAQIQFEHNARQPRGEGALSPEQAVAEARRCLSCGACAECDNCWKYCPDQAVIKPVEKGQPYRFRLEFCRGCSKCAEQCPTGFIEMR